MEEQEAAAGRCTPARRLPRNCRRCGQRAMVLEEAPEAWLDAEYVCPACGYRTYC